jgi:hypothetical protein
VPLPPISPSRSHGGFSRVLITLWAIQPSSVRQSPCQHPLDKFIGRLWHDYCWIVSLPCSPT